jgi:hypothetical protein
MHEPAFNLGQFPVISDTNEGGIRTSAYSLATIDVPRMLWFTNVLSGNAILPSVVICNG